MATKMPADWEPRAEKRRTDRTGEPPRANWQAWADGAWWALKLGVDLDPARSLTHHYRAAWAWADYRACRCEGFRDERERTLYLRITCPDPDADGAR